MKSEKFLCALVFTVLALGRLRAAEDRPPTSDDAFAVPASNDTNVLSDYCRWMLGFQPKNRADLERFNARALPVLRAVCEKILAKEGDGSDNGHFARQNLIGIESDGLETADVAAVERFVTDARQFVLSPKFSMSEANLVMGGAMTLSRISPEKAKELNELIYAQIDGLSQAPGLSVSEILTGMTIGVMLHDFMPEKGPVVVDRLLVKAFAALQSPKLTLQDALAASEIGGNLDRSRPAKCKEFYIQLGRALKRFKEPEAAKLSATVEAVIRRLDLIGKEMILTGTTTGGAPFNLHSLKGKVVLLDFWATWCGPCRAEFPNIRRNYEGYHAKGFEVVGVSVDADRAQLDKYLAVSPLPWLVLNETAGKNDALLYYAIDSFPTTILIGKDGKVISLRARDEELGRLLKVELGEPAQ